MLSESYLNITKEECRYLVQIHESIDSSGVQDSATTETIPHIYFAQTTGVYSNLLRYLWVTNNAVAHEPYLELGAGYMETMLMVYARRLGIPFYVDIDSNCMMPRRLGRKPVFKFQYDLESDNPLDFLSKDIKYGTIVASEVLEHLDKSKMIALVRTIKDYLEPNSGRFIVTMPLAYTKDGIYYDTEPWCGHKFLPTLEEAIRIFENAGLEFEYRTLVAPLGFRSAKSNKQNDALSMLGIAKSKRMDRDIIAAVLPWITDELPDNPKDYIGMMQLYAILRLKREA